VKNIQVLYDYLGHFTLNSVPRLRIELQFEAVSCLSCALFNSVYVSDSLIVSGWLVIICSVWSCGVTVRLHVQSL